MAAPVGILGGSGLYEMEGFQAERRERVETPFGAPSDEVLLGRLEGVDVAFIPRHGRGHRLSPTEVPYRANVYALKSLGCERLISVSAVGSLKDEIRPGDLVICDQFIDRTKGNRASTFFGEGCVVHVGFGEPTCADLRGALVQAARAEDLRFHPRGTYVCMEGPQFSTRAESLLYRSWAADVVGMTNLPEAKLAREAELCYATIALSTDYDCWHPHAEPVTAEQVIRTLLENVERAKRVLRRTVPAIAAAPRACACGEALRTSIATSPAAIAPAVRRKLGLFLDPYLRT